MAARPAAPGGPKLSSRGRRAARVEQGGAHGDRSPWVFWRRPKRVNLLNGSGMAQGAGISHPGATG